MYLLGSLEFNLDLGPSKVPSPWGRFLVVETRFRTRIGLI